MIQSNELRIGNLVTIGGSMKELCSILSVSKKLIGYDAPSRKGNCNIEWIEPIPLTEEWLINFGFSKNSNGFFNMMNESEIEILIRDGFWTCDGICFSVNFMEYVHQLQNLYFALTGKELDYDPNR